MTINELSPKHWAKFILRSEYRKYTRREKELEKLKNAPRYTPLSTSILGKPLNLLDGKSFYYSYRELWENKIYKFLSKKANPFIIDGGSNIGLSIIYLKELYPKSKIIGFEADPVVYKTLQANLNSFGYDDVEIYNNALWKEETTLEFAIEGADAGRIARDNEEELNNRVKVPAVCLSKYLFQPIDFLKLDIEGAETAVLQECANHLHQVKNLFVEYHSFREEPQTLSSIINILSEAGFRLHIHPCITSPQPFFVRHSYLGMDMQLNIFAFRE
jgi:FkbM family methyltransferase